MARKESLNYQQVAEACNNLVKMGEKPSLRKLRDQLGGSFSTISELLGKWQQQNTLANDSSIGISEELKQCLFAQFAQAAKQAEIPLVEQINNRDERLNEMRKLLADQETELSKQAAEIEALIKNHQTKQIELEKRIAVAESKTSAAEKREAQLAEQIEILRDKCHEAELQAAVYKTRAGEYEKQILKLDRKKSLQKNAV